MRVQCYDERAYFVNAVKLHDPVDTLSISGVGLSLPSGVLKLNLSRYITHMKFMYHGEEWIVKVNARESLGGDLFNISYSIDYVKDYWNKYADKPIHAVLHRTTEAEKWSKYIPDNQYPLQGVSSVSTSTGTDIGEGIPILTTQSGAATSLYTTSTAISLISSWKIVSVNLMADVDFNNCVTGAFLIPKMFTSSMTSVSGIPYIKQTTGESGVSWSSEFYLVDGAYTISNREPLEITVNTGISLIVSDWRDVYTKKYALYVPYIGMINIDPSKTKGNISVTYNADPIGGSIRAYLNNDRSTMTNPSPLPIISIASSSAVAQVRQLNNSASASLGGSLAATALNTVAGAAMGNPALLLTGAVGAVGSLISNDLSRTAAAENAAIGSVSYNTATGYDGILNSKFILTTVSTPGVIDYADFASINGFLADSYLRSLGDLPAKRYAWLDMSNAVILGGSDYAENVRSAYHNNRIFVN